MKLAEGVGNAPTSACADPVFGTGAASLYLPAFQELAARVGLAPTPSGLTGRRATLTPPGKGAAGRISTCIVPLRRRMPDVFDHGSNGDWSARQELHLRSLGPKPSALAATLRAEIWRTRRELHPQPSRRQRVAPLIELRVREMVGGAGNAPAVASDRFNDARVTAGWSEHLPENGSGGRSCTYRG
jgi:hypothetical protein